MARVSSTLKMDSLRDLVEATGIRDLGRGVGEHQMTKSILEQDLEMSSSEDEVEDLGIREGGSDENFNLAKKRKKYTLNKEGRWKAMHLRALGRRRKKRKKGNPTFGRFLPKPDGDFCNGNVYCVSYLFNLS